MRDETVEVWARLGLGPERLAAIGQSFGGMVAADLAASFPRLFGRLVLLAPPAAPRPGADAHRLGTR